MAPNMEAWRTTRTLFRRRVAAFFSDDAGATALEYGLIASIMAAVTIAVFTTYGTALRRGFDAINLQLKFE